MKGQTKLTVTSEQMKAMVAAYLHEKVLNGPHCDDVIDVQQLRPSGYASSEGFEITLRERPERQEPEPTGVRNGD